MLTLKTLFPNKTGREGQIMNSCMDMKYTEQENRKARMQWCLMGGEKGMANFVDTWQNPKEVTEVRAVSRGGSGIFWAS